MFDSQTLDLVLQILLAVLTIASLRLAKSKNSKAADYKTIVEILVPVIEAARRKYRPEVDDDPAEEIQRSATAAGVEPMLHEVVNRLTN